MQDWAVDWNKVCIFIKYSTWWSNAELLVVLVWELLEELVVYQLPDRKPIFRVLFQTWEQEISALLWNLHVIGDFYFVFDNFNEVFLPGYFEWIFTHQHFVHHHTQWPNINFLVVLLALEDLRPNVERSTTEGSPEIRVAVNRPSEVAQLDHILRIRKHVHPALQCSMA